MIIIKNIPNLITCLNLVSGCVAIVMAFGGNMFGAMLWIIIASVFDFCDGLVARLLNAYSALGKELDSLGDIVSFGVAPGMLLYCTLGEWVYAASVDGVLVYLPYISFIVPALSGLRLAKFNLDERQVTSFIGLPVPAHALLWASACYSLQTPIDYGSRWVAMLLVISFIVTSCLLISEIPMFSMKVKNYGWKGNELRYVLIVCTVGFIVILGFLGIAVGILLYIILSLLSAYGGIQWNGDYKNSI